MPVQTTNNTSVERLNASNRGKLPDYVGLEVTAVADGRVEGRSRSPRR